MRAVRPHRPPSEHKEGFTLIEMLIVMALVALLLSLALPRYFIGLERGKEAVLRENLRLTRVAIDQFYGDQGRYPDSLQELVARQYLRELPLDPVLEQRNRWTIIAPPVPLPGGVADLRSAAPGLSRDGEPFAGW